MVICIKINMLDNLKSVYIIGIGGISLSAIAVFLKKFGIEVYGSDIHDSDVIGNLRKQGFKIVIGSSDEFVIKSDAVIYTSAISDYNQDILLAKKLGKHVYSRAEVLGMLSEKYKTISVAGSHGKTTTTGMISNIFLCAGKNPNIHVGGILNNINSNVRIGDGEFLITEACEYKDSFLQLKNYISVVLNIQEDHLDYFKNLDNIFYSFEKFAQNTDKNGVFIYNFDDFLAKNIKLSCKKLSYGLGKGSDVHAINIIEYDKGRYSFEVEYLGKNIGKIFLPCYGKHNIYNALASIVAAYQSGIKFTDIKKGIETFKGIKRRFERISEINNNLIIHDYAHHPDEIKATIKTCRELGYDNLVVIFQPHTFSRTQALYKEFLNCFTDASEVWLLPVYPARERPIKGVSSYKLYQDIKKTGFQARYFSSFQKAKDQISKRQKTLFAILGAGDIENLANMLR